MMAVCKRSLLGLYRLGFQGWLLEKDPTIEVPRYPSSASSLHSAALRSPHLHSLFVSPSKCLWLERVLRQAGPVLQVFRKARTPGFHCSRKFQPYRGWANILLGICHSGGSSLLKHKLDLGLSTDLGIDSTFYQYTTVYDTPVLFGKLIWLTENLNRLGGWCGMYW